jgi:DNA mismatch endonuclease (patch repair protein)
MNLMRRHHIIGWRRHQPIFGKPDFVFRRVRVAVFVDGCFWHACPKHSNIPVNNKDFWKKKLSGNQVRDRLVTKTLHASGWHVVRIWEHELRKPARLLIRLRKALR